MNRPKVSILIPTYNRPEFLRQCLDSVVKQSVSPYEVIVADDNLNPKENIQNREVVEEFSKKYRFVYYYKNDKNYGPAGNYKNLFELASGDYIQFLGDDDILSPLAVERLSKPLMESKEVFISAGRTLFVDRNLNINVDGIYIYYLIKFSFLFRDRAIPGKAAIKFSAQNNMMNIFGSFSGFMFRKKDIDFTLFSFDGYEFIANSDIFLWMNLAKKGKVFLYRFFSNLFRLHGENDQIRLQKRGIEEIAILYSDKFLKSVGIRRLNKYLSSRLNSLVRYSLLDEANKNIINLFYKDTEIKNHQRDNFSIIIVTYKNEETIERCLSSVLHTVIEGDEIILVDNSPDDLTINAVKRFSEKYDFIKIIKSLYNWGYAKAINEGVKASKNNLLVFLNPDTEVISKNWLEKFSEKFREDEKIASVGAVSNSAFFKNSIIEYIDDTYALSKLSNKEIADLLEKSYKDRHVETYLLSGFCIATRKEIFIKYGMFDEKLILGFDDFDYSMFLKENGYKQVVLPSVYVYHENHHSFEKEKSKSEHLNKVSFDNFMKKLMRKYGYGNVPEPYEYFLGRKMTYNYPFFHHLKSGKYRFIFNFSGKQKDKDFFRQKSALIKSNPKIAVITVNYKTYKDVLELARSIVGNPYRNIDFVVVDNSEDETEFKNLEEGLKYIFENRVQKYHLIKNINNGYAGGNNLGIRYALENINPLYIWLLNPDTIITNSTPIELIRTVEYTDVPVVSCKILDYYSGLSQYNGMFASYKPVKDKKYDNINIFRLNFLSGANIFMRKEVIENAGMFDESYFLYFEDNDFFSRLKENNIYPLYTPFTHIYHKGAVSTGGFLQSTLSVYYYTRNLLIFMEKESKKLGDFSLLLHALEKDVFHLYLRNVYKKEKLLAILLALEDYIDNIRGRVEIDNRITPYLKNKKRDSNLVDGLSIKQKVEYLKLRTKDTDTLIELLRATFTIKADKVFSGG